MFDVAIIGGGPAGSAASIVLAGAGRKVALIEASHYEEPRIGESLPPETALPLGELGMLENLVRAGHLPSSGIVAIWGSSVPHHNDFLFNPYGSGWHVDRRRFDQDLARHAERLGSDLLLGHRAIECRHEGNRWRVSLRTGARESAIYAGAIINATGRSGSPLRALMGRPVIHDRLIASFCRLRRDGEMPDGNRTVIEATPDGWWYSAPLPDSLAIFAFFCGLSTRCDAASWRMQIASTQLTRNRYQACRPCETVRITSANSFHSPTLVGPGWMAAGDSACCHDPLSSQGVYFALHSGIDAGHTLLGAHSLDSYSRAVEEDYAQYLVRRHAFYRRVERYAESPFWQDRVSFRSGPHCAPPCAQELTQPIQAG